jgi:type I restriction enzyme S subunit
MELMEGFKQTELGLICSDWTVVEFQEVMEGFSSGQTPYRGNPEFFRGDIPWITSGELNYNIVVDTKEKITPEGMKDANLKKIPKGTFLIAITGLEAAGTRGSCAITGVDATTNQSCMALYPKKDKLITQYLFHFYVRFGNELAFKYCQGTKQQSYTAGLAKRLPIILPPSLPEQNAIATALSDMDALIAHTEKLIEKKKAIKQGMMQQLLSPYDAEGKLKEGWAKKKLGECLFDIPDYGLNAAAVPFSENLPLYLRITDITDDGKYSKKNTVSVNNSFSSLFFLRQGDLVFARTGASVGKTYLYNEKDGMLVFAGFLIRVRSNPEILLPEYLKYYTQTKPYKEWIIANSMRTGQPGINGREFQEMFLDIPILIAEQTRITASISALEEQIDVLERKIEKLNLIKQAMMQTLLTGKIRIYKPEHEPTTKV